MKEMDILQAVGHVDDRFLEELETAPQAVRKHKNLWRVALAAAIISMLSLTAVAAPAVINALKGGNVSYKERGEPFPYVDIYGYDNGIMTSGYELLLNIEVDPNAPTKMQEAWIPDVLIQNHPSRHCVWADYGLEYWCKYIYEDGRQSDIRYEQYVIPAGGNGTYRAKCRGLEEKLEPETRVFQVEQFEVMEIIFRQETHNGGGIRQLYWSDGMYIYYVLLDLDVPVEFYESLIVSVRPVENIDDYLTPWQAKPPMLNATPTEPDTP